MRLGAGVAIAVLVTAAAATSAAAQTPSSLNTADALRSAAFTPRTSAQSVDPGAQFIEHESYRAGQGPTVWQSGEVRLSGATTLRVNVGGALRTPSGLPLNLQQGRFEPHDLDVTLIKSWPDAVSVGSDKLEVAVSPHAGVGFSNAGGQAEAGAMLRVSKPSRDAKALQRLKDLGVADGTTAFADSQGRWYLFAAASGRAVGLNMLHDERGWDRAGWTTDPTASLVGDAQIGVGWRKGEIQSSFGIIHREVKGQHMIFGQQTRDDTVAAFSFSIRPQR